MDRLRMRILVMEAWVAIQARPYLDDRILGLLELLAEQFGVPCAEGRLIDLRLTHAQLATAVGATRSTVIRIVRELRVGGAVVTIGAGERERFCLRHWHGGAHVSGQAIAENVVIGPPKPREKAS
jgi:CRP-like cAMP-binding protein